MELTKRSCGYDPVSVGIGWDGKGYQIKLKLSEIPSLTVLRNFHTTINAKRKKHMDNRDYSPSALTADVTQRCDTKTDLWQCSLRDYAKT